MTGTASRFDRFERYTVSLTGTHWESLMTRGVIDAWAEARQMGLTVEQCDRIALAAVAGVRDLIEMWAQQQRAASGEQPGPRNET